MRRIIVSFLFICFACEPHEKREKAQVPNEETEQERYLNNTPDAPLDFYCEVNSHIDSNTRVEICNIVNSKSSVLSADLVIEIVSPGSTNRERDLIAKRNDYAKAGVAEHWIVDPDEQTVLVLSLDGQSYRTHGEFKPGAVVTSPILAKFQINVTELFESAH